MVDEIQAPQADLTDAQPIDGPGAQLGADAGQQLEEAIVDRGTFVVDTPNGEQLEVGPGGMVRLPADEVARYRAAGKLRAADGSRLVPTGIGPSYDQQHDQFVVRPQDTQA